MDEARTRLAALAPLGIQVDAVTEQLEVEGVKKFADSFDSLLKTVESKRERLVAGRA